MKITHWSLSALLACSSFTLISTSVHAESAHADSTQADSAHKGQTQGQANNGFSIFAGPSDADQDLYRVAARIGWDKRWFDEADGDWYLGGYFETGVMYVDSTSNDTQVDDAEDNLHGLFFTPVLRFQREPYSNGVAPFVEAGVGVSYLSETHIKSDSFTGSDLGSHFQFEDKIAVGARFGQTQQYELSLNFLHYSNADLEKPNHGITAYTLGFGMWF